MPLVIKEIHVNTVVEKRVVLPDTISRDLYEKLKEEVKEELREEFALDGHLVAMERMEKER
jgi:hypothetical protein